MSDPKQYTVGWICAIGTEYVAAQAFLDESHEGPDSVSTNDNNDYALGRMGKHNVVIAVAPEAEYGLSSAAGVARDMMHSFPNIRIGLMVGIGGGVPSKKHDVRLGDIVVSVPRGGRGGVFQYDFGKLKQGQEFELTGYLNQPPTLLRTAVNGLKAQYEAQGHQLEQAVTQALSKRPRLRKNYQRPPAATDNLYRSEAVHPSDDDRSCAEVCGEDSSILVSRKPRSENDDDPTIHYGLIASANRVMKDAIVRDHAAREGVLCFEMEAAGLMNHFPCLVIRGICDYSDTHKNKAWQGFAAMNAAAYAKDLLSRIAPNRVETEIPIIQIMSGIEKQVDKLVRTHDLQETRTILDWITPYDYSARQLDSSNRRQEGTGQWILRSAKYQTWLERPKQPLFCSGIPGAGKTILASIVVDDLWNRFAPNGDIGIAYVYLDFQQRHQQTPSEIFSSILRQLVQKKSSVPELVKTSYHHHISRHSRPNLHEISSMLQSVAESYSRAFIVVDALDECQDEDREQLFSGLSDLRIKTQVNFFTTSRPNDGIARYFGDATKIEVRAAVEDVEAYVNHRLANTQHDVLSVDMREDVKSKILQASDGMFLLATLLLDMLFDCPTKGHLKRALSTLSTGTIGLNRTYEQAFERILDQSEWTKDFALKALMWIVHAKRQLSTTEIRHVLAVKPDASELDEDDIPSTHLLASISAGLISIDGESQTVRLVHHTLQEYLEQPLIQQRWFQDAQTQISLTCLDYLSLDVFSTGSCLTDEDFENRLQMYPFFSYAARNWGYHAYAASTNVDHKVLSFLEDDIKISSSSQAMMIPNNGRYYQDYSQKVPKRITSLHICAMFGLVRSAATLMASGTELDTKDERYGRSPLSWAAEHGQEAVIRLLLSEQAVDINSRDHSRRTPLAWAAELNSSSVIKLLLADKRVDVDLMDVYGRTPLFRATGNGHTGVVQMLLEDGRSDVNARDHLGQSPLSKAASCGYEAIIALLLNADHIDVNSKSDYLETPLWFAVSEGRAAVVRLLLDIEVVEIDIRDSNRRTSLWLAADNGDQAIVEMLLASRKVDVNSSDLNGDTPLLRATLNGHEAIVKLLLEADNIDVNCKNTAGQTSLWAALLYDHIQIIRLLLNTEGVNLDARDPNGNTPLMWATARGSTQMVELLLENPNVDVWARNSDGQRPIEVAIAQGRHELFFLLLAKEDSSRNLVKPGALKRLEESVEEFAQPRHGAADLDGDPARRKVLCNVADMWNIEADDGEKPDIVGFLDVLAKLAGPDTETTRYTAPTTSINQSQPLQSTTLQQPAVPNIIRQTWELDENGKPLEP